MSAGSPPGVRPLLLLIRGYQRWFSPFLPPRCRFYPSCSSYALQALAGRGLWRGSWLTLRRVLRCQPFAAGGYDPVPETPRRLARPQSSTASTGAPPC